MTKSELDKVDMKVVQAKYDAWKAGEMSDEDYLLFIWGLMENFVKYRISQKHRTVSAEYEDALSQGKIAIVQNYRRYDPYHQDKNGSEYPPAAFFKPYIDDETKQACKNDGLSAHYVKKAYMLEKAVKREGYSGLSDPRLTDVLIADISGESLKTVIRTLELKGMSIVSLEAASENRELTQSEGFGNPEDVLIHNILKEEIQDVMEERCTPLERFLLEHVVMSGKNVSFRKVCKYLNDSSRKDRFADEVFGDLTPLTVEQKVMTALRKIKNSPVIKRYSHDFAPSSSIFEFEEECQIQNEDIPDIINL